MQTTTSRNSILFSLVVLLLISCVQQPAQKQAIERMVIQCFDGSTANSLEECPEKIEQYTPQTIQQSSSTEQLSVSDGLQKCQFPANIGLDAFTLDRAELPQRFQERNSWEEYTIPDSDLDITVADGSKVRVGGVPHLKHLVTQRLPQLQISIWDYDSAGAASNYLSTILADAKQHKGNTKMNTGDYGEERVEYSDFNGHHNIHFRIKNFVISITPVGLSPPGESIIVARKIHNKLCALK
ncbi:hypothetical protein C4580_02375 [Candidatus Woesearchaeota archaeon]|nr:MAG: hypothetical protein C4580_02375 [Candidatus Woesearchaeota archaeon]